MAVRKNEIPWQNIWVSAWVDLCSMGSTTCPGCAAKLAPPWKRCEDGYRHDVCAIPCGHCGALRRLTTKGMACVGEWCHWFALWKHTWKQTLIDRKVYGDPSVSHRQYGDLGDLVVPAWRKDVVEAFPKPDHIVNVSDKELANAIQSLLRAQDVRYDIEAMNRKYLIWRNLFRDQLRYVENALKQRSLRVTLLVEALALVGMEVEQKLGWVDEMYESLMTIADDYSHKTMSERSRLLNPNFDEIEDAAEKRFALLEIDDDN